jgi:bicarbonate transport system ATP-binding protein
MYSNRENPSHKPLDNYAPDASVKTIELSPALKNASIAALVAVLAITGVSSLIVGASNTTAGETEETEEMASGNTTPSAPSENMEATTASQSPATTASTQAMAPQVTNTVEAISEPGKLADLNRQLYNTVNNAWRVTPVTADSRYRVRVTENGDIAEYEPTNQAAVNNTNNTPLPDLVAANSPAAGESPTVPYAEFEVIFKADNSLEVNNR